MQEEFRFGGELYCKLQAKVDMYTGQVLNDRHPQFEGALRAHAHGHQCRQSFRSSIEIQKQPPMDMHLMLKAEYRMK